MYPVQQAGTPSCSVPRQSPKGFSRNAEAAGSQFLPERCRGEDVSLGLSLPPAASGCLKPHRHILCSQSLLPSPADPNHILDGDHHVFVQTLARGGAHTLWTLRKTLSVPVVGRVPFRGRIRWAGMSSAPADGTAGCICACSGPTVAARRVRCGSRTNWKPRDFLRLSLNSPGLCAATRADAAQEAVFRRLTGRIQRSSIAVSNSGSQSFGPAARWVETNFGVHQPSIGRPPSLRFLTPPQKFQRRTAEAIIEWPSRTRTWPTSSQPVRASLSSRGCSTGTGTFVAADNDASNPCGRPVVTLGRCTLYLPTPFFARPRPRGGRRGRVHGRRSEATEYFVDGKSVHVRVCCPRSNANPVADGADPCHNPRTSTFGGFKPHPRSQLGDPWPCCASSTPLDSPAPMQRWVDPSLGPSCAWLA